MSQNISGLSPRHALGRALLNDSEGVVSARDARRIKNAIVDTVMRSADPSTTLADSMTVVPLAAKLARTGQAKAILEKTQSSGNAALKIRLELLTGKTQLPVELKNELNSVLYQELVVSNSQSVTVKNVLGSNATGYSFDVAAGAYTSKGYATHYDNKWVLTNHPVTADMLDGAVYEAQDYYDEIRLEAGPSFEDVAVEIRHADWDEDKKLVLSFSHGAPEGGLFAEYDPQAKTWTAWDEQM